MHLHNDSQFHPAPVLPASEQGWVRFSTEHRANVLAIDLYSVAQVRARVELTRGDTTRSARVTFSALDPLQAMVACLRAAVVVVDGRIDRQAQGLHALDAELVAEEGPPGFSRLELAGADAWRALIAVFGDAYAEALP